MKISKRVLKEVEEKPFFFFFEMEKDSHKVEEKP